MPLQLSIKDHTQEDRLFRNRVIVSIVIMGLLTLILIARLAELQIINYHHYITLSQENRVKILPIAPTRGLIFSRDGVVLAENRASFTLEVIPEHVPDTGKAIEELKSIITITEEDIQRFFQELKRKRRFENVPLRFNLSEEEVARFAVDWHRFPGIDIVARLTRFYPLGEQVAHVVGYMGRIDENELKSIDASNYSGTSHIGKIGVEKSYEEVLHGRAGYQQVEVNAQGRILRVLERTSPKPGKDLYLTLDVSLQTAAVGALGGRRGAIVAIGTQTGGVLALVSVPGYDPNLFVNGIDLKRYAQLRDSPDRPLFNRAIQAKYPPGSTIKPFLGLVGLETGLRIPLTGTWCPGWYSLPGQSHKYRCWKKPGHGQVSLKRAIVESCDVYFYDLARDLGIDRIHRYLSRFGFGQPAGIDLPGGSAGLLPSQEWKRKTQRVGWYPGETVITGIGQGYMLATPLQLASAVAMLANRGNGVRPTVVSRIQDPHSHKVTEVITHSLQRSIVTRPEYWDHIIGAMTDVVHAPTGTAKRTGEGAAYRFAGKTGTSQVFGIKQNQTVDQAKIDERLRDHALFIAFAPADKPLIAMAIIVENGGKGSQAAAPIARQLFDRFLLIEAAGTTSDDHG